MQVKILVGDTYAELERKVNDFLDELHEDPKEVRIDLENWSAVIEYDKTLNALCCECKWWDANDDDTIGLCQKRGGRKRFNNRCCKEYVDIRE